MPGETVAHLNGPSIGGTQMVLQRRSVHDDQQAMRSGAGGIRDRMHPIGRIAREQGLVESGYRLLANTGAHSGQEVPHLHVHIFGGRPLGPMLAA